MTTQKNPHQAVVIGCGIAGMAAAVAVRPFFDRVVIFEKDDLPLGPVPRKGIPQGQQLHNLLSAAQVCLEELLPGFCRALREAGGADISVAADTNVFELGIWMPKRDLGMRLMSASRPLIEDVARTLMMKYENVDLRYPIRVVDLEVNQANVAVGVKTMNAHDQEEVVLAELVIDASGTNPVSIKWLRDHGLELPTSIERVKGWYVSCIFELPGKRLSKKECWFLFPTPPLVRGGLVSPVEDGRWCISLSGQSSDKPPRDIGAFKRYASELEDPVIAELLQEANPISEIRLYQRQNAVWRHYDRVANMPRRLIPIGDAVVTLNPLLGQGMSVAAWQAKELSRCLREGELDEKSYLSRAAEICRMAWDLNSFLEVLARQLRETPERALEYLRTLAERFSDNAELHRDYVSVWHLLKPISAWTERESAALGNN